MRFIRFLFLQLQWLFHQFVDSKFNASIEADTAGIVRLQRVYATAIGSEKLPNWGIQIHCHGEYLLSTRNVPGECACHIHSI
jgi:hypothetical protein